MADEEDRSKPLSIEEILAEAKNKPKRKANKRAAQNVHELLTGKIRETGMRTMKKKRYRIAKKPRLSSLTFFGFQVNAAIERGYGEKLNFKNIHKGIEWGTLIEDLDKKLPDVFDFGPFTVSKEEREGFLEALRFAAGPIKDSEREYLIEKNGLSLLMAFILEAIQRRYWTK